MSLECWSARFRRELGGPAHELASQANPITPTFAPLNDDVAIARSGRDGKEGSGYSASATADGFTAICRTKESNIGGQLIRRVDVARLRSVKLKRSERDRAARER
jgi:hypothetical protein